MRSAFGQMRTHLTKRFAFGQMLSAFDQCRTPKFKPAAVDELRNAFGHWREGSAHAPPNAQQNLPNVCTFHQMCSHLAIVDKFDQMRSAIGQMCAHLAKHCAFVKCRTFRQMVRCAANLAKCADLSNAPYNDRAENVSVRAVKCKCYLYVGLTAI